MSSITQRSGRLAIVAFLTGVLMAALVGTAAIAITGRNAKNVTAVRTASQDGAMAATTSTTPSTVLSTTVGVPSGEQALLVINFSATSTCNDTSQFKEGICQVWVLIDGQRSTTTDWVEFDSGKDGPGPESHSAQWISPILGSGPHTVTVQQYVNVATTTTMQLRDPVLTVLRARV